MALDVIGILENSGHLSGTGFNLNAYNNTKAGAGTKLPDELLTVTHQTLSTAFDDDEEKKRNRLIGTIVLISLVIAVVVMVIIIKSRNKVKAKGRVV